MNTYFRIVTKINYSLNDKNIIKYDIHVLIVLKLKNYKLLALVYIIIIVTHFYILILRTIPKLSIFISYNPAAVNIHGLLDLICII